VSQEKQLAKPKKSDAQKYKFLVDEIKGTITEAVHNSRWLLIEGYWNVGRLIRTEFGNTGELTKLLTDLAVDVGTSERTLWKALAAYDKYPRLDLIPGGKNISWNKLITEYLTETTKGDKKSVTLIKCPKCGYGFEPKKIGY